MAQSAGHSEIRNKPVVLRDAGGGCLLWMIFPALFFIGVGFDFFWNMILLHVAAWLVPSPDEDLKKRRDVYALLITVLGILIDWTYFNLIWRVIPSDAVATRLLWLIFPAALLGAANLSLGILLLRRSFMRSMGLGIVMGVLTAPWLLLFILR